MGDQLNLKLRKCRFYFFLTFFATSWTKLFI